MYTMLNKFTDVQLKHINNRIYLTARVKVT